MNSSMFKSWDSELAQLAALNVRQCKMHHDKCRATQNFNYPGQNLGYKANSGNFESTRSLITHVIKDLWYNEEVVNAFRSDIEKCCNSAAGKVIGHFTQIVTDRAFKVGCAISQYTESKWKTSLIACNYAFTNFQGAKVYASGKSASECSSGFNPRFPALCSESEKIKIKLN